ncbi:scale keratin-like [Buteo buteo]|uniref:scale keratin-like n=1 Tax=Buteo buteo TaxID=30397 RepID=UPI003EBC7ACB
MCFKFGLVGDYDFMCTVCLRPPPGNLKHCIKGAGTQTYSISLSCVLSSTSGSPSFKTEMSCYDLCPTTSNIACPQPIANSCNEPCVRQCPDSTAFIQPPPVVVTFPGPILSSFPQQAVVGSSGAPAFGGSLGLGGLYSSGSLYGYGGSLRYGAQCGYGSSALSTLSSGYCSPYSSRRYSRLLRSSCGPC